MKCDRRLVVRLLAAARRLPPAHSVGRSGANQSDQATGSGMEWNGSELRPPRAAIIYHGDTKERRSSSALLAGYLFVSCVELHFPRSSGSGELASMAPFIQAAPA